MQSNNLMISAISQVLIGPLAKFSEKHLCQDFKKKRLWHRCLFPVHFMKFLRTPFYQNTSGRLILYLCKQVHAQIAIDNLKKVWNICWNLTIKTPERHQWRRSSVFIVSFEHTSNFFLGFLLFSLSKYTFQIPDCSKIF